MLLISLILLSALFRFVRHWQYKTGMMKLYQVKSIACGSHIGEWCLNVNTNYFLKARGSLVKTSLYSYAFPQTY